MKDDFTTRLLSKLPDSLIRLYRTGGVMLVLIFVGLICMAWAHFRNGNLSTPMFMVGALVIVTCLVLFVKAQLKAPLAIRRDVRLSAAVENLAVELTKTIDVFQSLGVKHLKYTEAVFGEAARTLPYLPKIQHELQQLGISNPSEIPHLITDASTLAKDTIANVKSALNKKDPKALMKQAESLAKIRQKINHVLSPPELHQQLVKAVTLQDIEWVRRLVEVGAPVDSIENGNIGAPLIAAIHCGNLEIVKMLLAADADPDARGAQSRTALILSVENNQPETMRALIDAKANLDFDDKSGRTSLMWAADTGNLVAANILIEAGADLEREDFSHKTAIERAQKSKSHDIVVALKAAGATR